MKRLFVQRSTALGWQWRQEAWKRTLLLVNNYHQGRYWAAVSEVSSSPSEGILLSLSPHPPTSHPPFKNLRVCHPCCTFSMQHITKIFPLMVISGSFELLSTKLTQKEVRPQSVKVVGPLSYRLICYENNFPNTTSPKKNFSPSSYKGLVINSQQPQKVNEVWCLLIPHRYIYWEKKRKRTAYKCLKDLKQAHKAR